MAWKLILRSKVFLAGLLLLACASRLPMPGSQSKVAALLQREAASLPEATRQEMAALVEKLAKEYDLDPMLIASVIFVESRFKPAARSNKGALGLMQVKPIVVREVADQMGIDPREHPRLITDWSFNLRVGVHYLSWLLEKFRGDMRKALYAYNAGPTTTARLYKNRPVPAGGYPGRVLSTYARYAKS